jgi:hypothetical protein
MSNPAGSIYGEIGLAVFRPDEELLRIQVNSIVAQTLQSWTCHVAIDGSDPRAAAALSDLVKGDKRFVVHAFDDNVGFYRNFERLVGLFGANAAWVALCDQDDYWYPEKLQKLVEVLQTRGSAAVSGQARVVSDDRSSPSYTRRSSTEIGSLMFDNQVTGSMTVFRKTALDLALPFPDPTDAAYHDHWLGVLAKTQGEITFLDACLQDYVQHGGNVLGEEGGHQARRLKSLFGAGKSSGGVFRHLASQRWGWRVRMARTLSERLGAGHVDPIIGSIARGSLSPRVVRSLSGSIIRREVGVGRGLGLLLGSIAWSLGLGRT